MTISRVMVASEPKVCFDQMVTPHRKLWIRVVFHPIRHMWCLEGQHFYWACHWLCCYGNPKFHNWQPLP
jgi:hypothetical protein